MLLTLGDLEDRRRYLNASATLDRLLEAGVIPVINENDSVATEEIRFGDNDRLAARVAQAANADLVLLLSDVDGLYDRDPRAEGAALVPVVDAVSPEVLAMASGASSSGLGSGGMISKLQAAQIATRAGIALAILNGTHESPIANAVAADCGTLFLPVRADSARKAWLGGRLAPAGELRVDKGCAEALRGGASLLAAGVVGVSGTFRRGDLVSVLSLKGEKLAQGLAEYDAAEMQLIAGKRAEDQAERLGYAPRSCVIHRDHMVLL
jgi:glutamate 5-kinase